MRLLAAALASAVAAASPAAARAPPLQGDKCWSLDGVAAIQVEVVQYTKPEPGTSLHKAGVPSGTNATADQAVAKGPLSSASQTADPVEKRSAEDALPASIGHHAPDDKAAVSPAKSGGIIHTRGHFNSMVSIFIFAGLACVAISTYCCVVLNSGEAEPEFPEKQQKGIAAGDGRLAEAAASLRDMKPNFPASRSGSAGLPDAMAKKRSLKLPEEAEPKIEKTASVPAPFGERRFTDQSGLAGANGSSVVRTRTSRRQTWSSVGKAWSTERWSPEEGEETMSATAFVVNIVADLCPSGFLSIAYGMDGTGYVWVVVLTVVFYALCVYTMWCCGRTCEISGERDFASQWALVVGPGGSWIPLLVIVIVAFGALLCYSCYFGDLLQEVMPALGIELPRYACLISFSLFPALPLCLLKNLSALAYSSFGALLSLIYTAVVMIVRLGDGTYAEGGYFFQDVREDLQPVHPSGDNMWMIGPRSLLFINILAMAFHCHCNACKYYRELKGTTPRHFRNVTILAMGIAMVLYLVIGFVGFRTFGTAANGTILKNYSLNDMPVNVARVLISLSLAASYAIMFSALREAFIGMLKHACSASIASSLDLVWRQDVLSGVLVGLITICGVVSKDSGLVDGFVGAFCGNAIIYIIPCLLYCAAVKSFLSRERNRPGLAFSSSLVALGVLLAIAGCVCLVMFEVEAEPHRPVQHHWRWNPLQVHQPQITDGDTVEKRHLWRPPAPERHSTRQSRPGGRHLFSMR